MTPNLKQPREIDPNTLKVQFSPAVQRALADLKASVHFAEGFDADIRAVLENWTSGKPPSVQGLLAALPTVAEEVFNHIKATGNERAAEAWREFSSQMNENGFALISNRVAGRY